MLRETKFGYGFLGTGIGVPILILIFWGDKFAAAIAASILTVVGAAFLIGGHLHRDAPQRRSKMATIGIFTVVGIVMGGLIGLLCGIAYVKLKKTPEPTTAQDKGSIQPKAIAPAAPPIIPTPKSQTSAAAPRESVAHSIVNRSLHLSEQIMTWVRPKFAERNNYIKGSQGLDAFAKRNEFDNAALREFDNKYEQALLAIIAELDKCNADTKSLKDNIKNRQRVESFGVIGVSLRQAAHSVPEGQPNCGTGAPTPGFGQRNSGMYSLLIGPTVTQYYKEDLQNGSKDAPTSTLGGRHTFKVYVRDGIFCLDAQIFGSLQMPIPVITVTCNRIDSTLTPGFDTNYTSKAAEVVDQNQIPILQLIFESDRSIRVNGVFLSNDNKVWIYSPQGAQHFDQGASIEVPLKRIFKYPSWRYQGQYEN